MKITRALAIRDDAYSGIVDLFSMAESHGLTHVVMLERRGDIYARCKLAATPRWVGSYLRGAWQVLQAHAYRDHLVFGGMIDGHFRSTHADRDDYYEKHGIEPREYADAGRVEARGHYWRRGLKPFAHADRDEGIL